ncbi:hypothetical protein [Pedobacter sp. UBA4863]|uniref:hypothetical protein n=1 Tax=Pedobacter sp. UBA4863 TaxID=1947060 RepID=UPI0025F98AD1|nr:hypothetical protein [Pedobacter sp. UBA4863]
MKAIILTTLLLMATTIATKAQKVQPTKTADFANWVIESNIKTPKISVIKFYNAQQELIYQEEIKNKRINVNKIKVQKQLNKILAQLVERNTPIKPYNLVAASLKAN